MRRLSAHVAFLAAAVLTTAGGVSQAGPRETGLAWQIVRQSAPSVFWTDRNHDVRITVRNVGTAAWSYEAGDRLAYHWLSPSGQMVERDGIRTMLPHTVAPGESIDLVARVHSPASPGRWLFEWEMVREQVAWYGPPTGATQGRVTALVVWRCGILQVLFLGATGVLVAVGWRLRRASPSRQWAAGALVPLLWSWAGAGLVTVTFSEIVGRQLWRGGGILAAAGAALLVLPLAFVAPRWRAAAAGALVVCGSLVGLADAVYLRYFDTVVPVVALTAFRQLGQVEGSVRALLRPADAWMAVTAFAGVVFALAWPRFKGNPEVGRRARVGVLAGGALACVVGGAPAIWALASGMADPAIAEQVFSHQALVGRWGVVNVHLFDALRTLREWVGSGSAKPEDVRRVDAFFAGHRVATGATTGFGVARGSNLLLIQVESLQQWVVGARVKGQEVTPFLAGLRKRALYFPRLFDQSGHGRSSDGEFAVLNSLHPLDRGAVVFRRPDNRFVALPEVLRQQGYSTLSAHPFERGFWNRGVVHPRYGFERMLFKPELGPGEVIGWGLADGVFFDRMVAPIRAQRAPWFAFLITLGLHHPFDLFPDRHKELDIGGLAGSPLGNYLHAMHYFDESLGAFVGALDASGVLNNTVVALYGDHEAGLAIERPLLELAGMGAWEPSAADRLRRVPLFILLPQGRLAAEVDSIGGHVDVAPTLLALLGVPQPGCFIGSPLVPGRTSVVPLNDGSAVAADRIFVATGRNIPVQGACYAFPEGQPRPLADCHEIAGEAAEELFASRFVVLHDLAADLAARPAGSGPASSP
jgi:phosphoglycerol transferase MdoB-like AlkP superfamily enzyme